MENSSCIVNPPHADCFSVLTEAEQKLLNGNKIDLEYKKGENLTKQGAYASHILFLQSGLVKVYMEGPQEDLIVKIVTSQHLLGLSSIHNKNNTFTYSTGALTDCMVRMYDRNVFIDVLRSNPEFAFQIISILNQNTSQVYGRFYCMTQKQAHGKIADLLMCLSNRVYNSTKFDLPLSRKEFSNLIGLSHESVSRIFKQFKEENLIKVKGSLFEIINAETLEKISNHG